MGPLPCVINVWRDFMQPKSCACCGLPFHPVPQVPDQAYCSQPECQRVRRQRWYQQKLENDPDYRDNKQRSQRDWMDRNPDYWRQYRADNPEYTNRNRSRQRAKPALSEPANIAKIDASNWPQALRPGIYRIRPLQSEQSGEFTAWTVEITPVCLNCACHKEACKVDACKDRT